MRAVLGLALCTMLFACGDNGNSSPDMTALPPDMTAPPVDMTTPPDLEMMKLGCRGVLMCLQTTGDVQGCSAKGTSKADNLLLAAVMCGQTACKSMTSTDASMDCTGGISDFTNQTCQACIAGVLQAGAAGSGPCKNQVAACLADKP